MIPPPSLWKLVVVVHHFELLLMLRLYFFALSLGVAIGKPWMDSSQASEKRALLLLVQMTIDEKVLLEA